MIQFNLLPDVKLEYIKAQRIKRLVLVTAGLTSAAALAVFIMLVLTVHVLQRKNISDLTADIKKTTSQLKAKPQLNKILTIQNQLNSLNSLHEQKPVVARLPDFMSELTPTTDTISDLQVDFQANTMSISGNSQSLDSVNQFTDALKFTKYYIGNDTGNQQKAFSDVVLSAFSRNATSASYTITLSFDPTIFSSDNDVHLAVPNIVTTRSVVEQPTMLFQSSTTPGGQ